MKISIQHAKKTVCTVLLLQSIALLPANDQENLVYKHLVEASSIGLGTFIVANTLIPGIQPKTAAKLGLVLTALYGFGNLAVYGLTRALDYLFFETERSFVFDEKKTIAYDKHIKQAEFNFD